MDEVEKDIFFIAPCICKSPLLEYVADDEYDKDATLIHKNEVEALEPKLYLLKLLCLADERLPNRIQLAKLFQFLYLSEGSIPKAYNRLLRYYKFMEYFPEIYVNRLATFKEAIKNTWRKIICITLPKLTPKGQRVYYIGGHPNKPSPRVGFLDVFQCFLACLEASVLQFRISLHSMIVVDTRFLDTSSGSLDKTKFRQFLDRYMPLCRGGALPINVEKVFFLFSVKNDAMWKIYRYILNFDLGDMVIFISTCAEYSKLMKYIPPKWIPTICYGLFDHSLDDINERTIKLVIRKAKHIKKEEEIRSSLPAELIYKLYESGRLPLKSTVLKKLANEKKQEAKHDYFRHHFKIGKPKLESDVYK